MPRLPRNDSGTGGLKPNRSRDWVILVVFAAVLVVICGRLFYIQVIKAPEYAQKADNVHIEEEPVPAKRGTIYDRNGVVLASSVDTQRVVANPKQVADPVAVSQLLEKYLGKEQERNYQDYYELVTTAGSQYVAIKHYADVDTAAKIIEEADKSGLSGLYLEPTVHRVYPNGNAGSQIVGQVNGEGKGTTGLELQYDELVGGVDGKRLVERSRGREIPVAEGVVEEEPAVEGADIVCSIDVKLQQKAQRRLKRALKTYGAKSGSVTVLDAATGEIYAACSLSRSKKKGGAVAYKPDVGKIWSITDSYEPGSTFKSITLASVLKNTSLSADSKFTVPYSYDVYDATIHDSHAHGTERMSLRDIIAESSNVGTMLAAKEVKASKLYRTYTDFGFGSNPGTDFPGVASGQVKRSEEWDGVQRQNVTFGQGLLASALQVARAYGAIEQEGILRVPHFLMDVPQDEEKTAQLTGAFSASSKAAGKKVCRQVTSMLRSVVEYGTGESAAIPRFKVAGKSGTAEVADETGTSYLKDAYIVSFVGWLEGSTSDLVCLVTMERPNTDEGGGPVCGPVFADIMQFAIERYKIAPNG